MAISSRTSLRSTRASGTPPELRRVPWSVVGPELIELWGYPGGRRMPEHLEILGPNGSGKTYAQDVILMMRAAARESSIVLLSTKPKDESLDDLVYPDGKPWKTITKWPPPYGVDQVIYAARAKGLSAAARAAQRTQVMDLLNEVWVKDSNRILVLDEIGYLQQELHLASHLNTMYREARALGLTLVSNTQRPVGTTRYMHSESPWKLAFAPQDEDDAKRVAEIMGNRRYYTDVLMSLDSSKFEFILQYSKTGLAVITHI